MKMVIHQQPHRVTRINLYGLLDQEDALLLSHECFQLIHEGLSHCVIDLSHCTRISEAMFEVFQELHQTLNDKSGTLIFIAPQKSLYFKLLDHNLKVKLYKQETHNENMHVR